MIRPLLVVTLLGGIVSCTPTPDAGSSGNLAPAIIRTGEHLHIVRRGESLTSIARQYNVTEKALRDRNLQKASPGTLEIGTELWIPPSKPEVRRIEPARSEQ